MILVIYQIHEWDKIEASCSHLWHITCLWIKSPTVRVQLTSSSYWAVYIELYHVGQKTDSRRFSVACLVLFLIDRFWMTGNSGGRCETELELQDTCQTTSLRSPRLWMWTDGESQFTAIPSRWVRLNDWTIDETSSQWPDRRGQI